MKLVTYDDGKVGRIDGDEIVAPRRADDARVLRARRRRRHAERARRSRTCGCARRSSRRSSSTRPATSASTRRSRRTSTGRTQIAPWINFFQNVDAIIGPDEPVIYPEHLTEELDYELELAVVLKKAGKWFSPEEAADYIGGYVIFNDITARDIQRGEMRSGVFCFCKAIDTFCPLGPWIVTPDEIPDPHDLAMELRVNGEPRQESHSSRMSVTIPEILTNFSALGYSAGDVLSTGTVAGVAGFKSPEERALALPEAGRRDRGRDRADRRAAQPGHLVAGGPRRARASADSPLGRSLMPWPRDDAKLERVRALMAERELDALVVRAPDNVLYLTNFWGMKGYDACVFPREGEPVLICLEASAEDAARDGVDEGRPARAGLRARRSAARSGAHARGGARGGRRATERSASSSRWARRRPTAWSASRRRSRRAGSTRGRTRSDATPVLVAGARDQDRAGGRADAARERDLRRRDGARARPELQPGMKESEAAALWQGFVHGEGTGWKGKVELALGFSLVWAGPRDQDVHGDGRPAGRRGRADAVRDLGLRRRLLGRPHEAPLPRRAARRLPRARAGAAGRLRARSTTAARARAFAELDRLVRDGLAGARLPGPAVAPDLPRRRRPRARAAVRAPGRRRHDRGGHGARDRAGLLLGGRRRPARRGQLPDHRDGRREALAVPRRSGACLT